MPTSPTPIHHDRPAELLARLGTIAASVGLAGGILAAACAPAPTAASPSVDPDPAPSSPAAPEVARRRPLAPPEPLPYLANTAVWFHGSDGADVLDGSEGIDLVHAYAGDDVLRGYAGDDHMHGFAGDDLLLGGTGDDSLEGAAGDDRLVGGSGDDVLEGGPGDDVLEGGPGDDVYVFVAGGGHDVIRERATRGGHDVIELEALTQAEVIVQRRGDDLQLLPRSGDGSITVEGFFAGEAQRVETVRFADGKVLPLSDAPTGSARLLALK